MLEDNLLYLVYLHSIGISHKKLHFIFRENQLYKQFYENISFNKLRSFYKNEQTINYILKNKDNINFDNIKSKLKQRNVKIITFFDQQYPENIKHISSPPFLLYLRGNVDNGAKISIVGSRKITSYGENIIKNIIPDLSSYFIIVSGGADGCDTKAHIEAIANGNKTISIIGTGIDIDYPIKNKKLYDKIVDCGGGVISIFPIGEVGNSYNFPIRNELVAGISNGVLVVEAGEKSGTLITSNLALELGKDLFVVPLDIFKINSIGCNKLLKNGNAKLVTNALDILEEYNILLDKNNINKIKDNKFFIDKIEEQIYNILLLEDLTIDQISKKIGLDIKVLLFKIGFMEINNLIKKSNNGKYRVY